MPQGRSETVGLLKIVGSRRDEVSELLISPVQVILAVSYSKQMRCRPNFSSMKGIPSGHTFVQSDHTTANLLGETHQTSNVSRRQKLRDTRQEQITAEKRLGMAASGDDEQGNVRHRADALLVLSIDRIILARKQQTRHCHGRQDLSISLRFEAPWYGRLSSASFFTRRARTAGGTGTPQMDGMASAPCFGASIIRSGPACECG